MKTYRVFLKRDKDNKIENLEIIDANFNYFALFFQSFYLFYNGIWEKGIIFLLFNILLSLTLSVFLILLSYIIVGLYFAVHFSDWKSSKLEKNGYIFLGIISGKTKKEAKELFLESFNKNYVEKDKMEQKVF